MQNTPLSTLEFEGITISPLDIENHTAKFDLAMFVMESEGGLVGSVNYRTDLFDASSIARLCERFVVLLQSIVAAPEALIKDLEIYTEEEKVQQVSKKVWRQEAGRSKLKVAKRSGVKLNGSDPANSPGREI